MGATQLRTAAAARACRVRKKLLQLLLLALGLVSATVCAWLPQPTLVPSPLWAARQSELEQDFAAAATPHRRSLLQSQPATSPPLPPLPPLPPAPPPLPQSLPGPPPPPPAVIYCKTCGIAVTGTIQLAGVTTNTLNYAALQAVLASVLSVPPASVFIVAATPGAGSVTVVYDALLGPAVFSINAAVAALGSMSVSTFAALGATSYNVVVPPRVAKPPPPVPNPPPSPVVRGR